MNIRSHYPSKRPSVKSVDDWNTVYTEDMENDWRGLYGGSVIVQRGYPFPDFYRIITNMGKPNVKKSKLFYGESAHMDVARYVYDLGFRGTAIDYVFLDLLPDLADGQVAFVNEVSTDVLLGSF